MTPAVLEQAAKTLWGADDWKFSIAVHCKTTPSTVNKWFRSGNVPGLVAAYVEALLKNRTLEREIERILKVAGGLP